MKIIEILAEGYKEAINDFVTDDVTIDTVKQTVDKYKKLVDKNQYDGAERNIDYWRKQGWDNFSASVTELEKTPTKTQIKKKEVVGTSITLFEDNKWLVVIPLDMHSSCFYGKDASWCTTSTTTNTFNDYFHSDNSVLIYVLNKITGSKLAIAYTDDEEAEYFDHHNNNISDTRFYNLTGLDPDKLIKLALEESNIETVVNSKDNYKNNVDTLNQLISSNNLDHKQIQKLLLLTHNNDSAVDYIKAYYANNNGRVTIPDQIALLALLKDPQCARYIKELSNSTYSKILKKHPWVFELFDKLPSDIKEVAIENLKSNVKNAMRYATLKNHSVPWLEKIISSSSLASRIYATTIIKKRFKDGERAILTDPFQIVEYCKLIGRWKDAEKDILKDGEATLEYIEFILKKSWPEAEKKFSSDAEWLDAYHGIIE